MLKEQDCKKEDRVLPILSTIRMEQLPSEELIGKWTKGKINTPEIQKFLSWERQDNQIVTYNGYGYCDTEIPKTYDFLIDLDDPQGGIDTEVTIVHAIYNGVVPLNTIEHGHKTVCVLEFSGGIPERLDLLLPFEESAFKFRFGLCSKTDKAAILERIKNSD